MKRSPQSFVLIFILFNGLLLAVCLSLYWLPEGSTLAVKFNSLVLQERRYNLKELNRVSIDENKQKLNALQMSLSGGDLILISFSEVLYVLAEIRAMAEIKGLTEIEFNMEEPVPFDTEALSVSIMEVSAVYQGDYGSQIALVHDLLNSACHVKTLDISKSESRMAVNFSLYGITE